MTVRNVICILVLSSLYVIIVAGGISASSGAEGHETSIMDWIWRVLNFAILVAVLVLFLGKPMKSYFKQRTELIEKSIKEASEAKGLAEKALREVEERLMLKDQEIEKIIEASRKSGEAEKDTLIQDGERMSQKIKDQARVNIEQELKDARSQLKAEAALLAIELAEKKIKEKLSHDDQLKILEESLKKIEEKDA